MSLPGQAGNGDGGAVDVAGDGRGEEEDDAGQGVGGNPAAEVGVGHGLAVLGGVEGAGTQAVDVDTVPC